MSQKDRKTDPLKCIILFGKFFPVSEDFLKRFLSYSNAILSMSSERATNNNNCPALISWLQNFDFEKTFAMSRSLLIEDRLENW